MYLEPRRRRWYAFLEIPKDVQEKLGRKRFAASLKTGDRRTADRRAALLEVDWLGQIEKARRGGSKDPIEADAAYLRERLAEAERQGDGAAREVILSHIADQAEAIAMAAARQAGTLDNHDIPDDPKATRFYSLATGKLVKLSEHLEAWLASVDNVAKTVDEKRSWVTRFADRLPYIQDVTRKDVQAWVTSLAQDEGHRPDTINKGLSSVRGYWKHLISLELVRDDNRPFDHLSIPRAKRKDDLKGKRRPFTPADVVSLWSEAKARGKGQLADLIQLAMWTGARIEELCALKLQHVHTDWFAVVDAKTKAGLREVPIHSKLKPLVTRLMKASKVAGDEYLLAGLSSDNKYDDRSPGIGKVFGRLKTDLGFGPEFVFHSIRRTVITQLENAGALEGVVADIVGHEKQTITFGLYSGGSSMAVKRKAIEKLSYPAPRKSKK